MIQIALQKVYACAGVSRLSAAPRGSRSQRTQASFGRTCRITLKCSGTYSSVSETSSPRTFSARLQSGHACCFGKISRVSRGRCAGRGCRAPLLSRFTAEAASETGEAAASYQFVQLQGGTTPIDATHGLRHQPEGQEAHRRVLWLAEDHCVVTQSAASRKVERRLDLYLRAAYNLVRMRNLMAGTVPAQ